MTTQTITQTQQVLADMMTENTGRHFLDSGGAYGRHWEHNQGLTAQAFIDAPTIKSDARWDYLDVTLDVFHWLADRLEYSPEMQAKFDAFSADSDDYWLSDMESFAEERNFDNTYDRVITENSYNRESILSQVIQWVGWNDQDDQQPYVLLQIHGGCDVRGGYTAPKAFLVVGSTCGSGDTLYDMLDERYTLACQTKTDDVPLPGMPDSEPHIWDYSNGEFTEYGGSFVNDPWNKENPCVEDESTGERFIRCPRCGGRLEASTWY